jgi:hypothetical protein
VDFGAKQEVPSIPVTLEVFHLIQVKSTAEIQFSLGMRNRTGEKVLVSFTVRDGRWLLGAIESGFVELKEMQSNN